MSLTFISIKDLENINEYALQYVHKFSIEKLDF